MSMIHAIMKSLEIAHEIPSASEDAQDKLVEKIIDEAESSESMAFCVKAVMQKLNEEGLDWVSDLLSDAAYEALYNDLEVADNIDYYRPDLEGGDWARVRASARSDAEIWFRCESYNHEIREHSDLTNISDDPNHGLKKGDVLEVVKGRKFPKGTMLVCEGFMYSEYNGDLMARVGKDENGKTQYVAVKNCKVAKLNDNIKTEIEVGDEVEVKRDVINPQTNTTIALKGTKFVVDHFYTRYDWKAVTMTEYVVSKDGVKVRTSMVDPVGYVLA